MNNVVKTLAAVAAFTLTAGATSAQTPPPPPAPAHQGILSRLFHPKPKPGLYQSNGSAMHPMGAHPYSTNSAHSYSTLGSHSMMSGQIIGNKNSHVYHMPGDKGALPSAQNRVYFPSAAAAQAAGYHAAGSSRGLTGGHPMMHNGTMSR